MIKLIGKVHNSICHLDISTWLFLGELIENGYPFMDALTFLHINDHYLKSQLEEGHDVLDVLLENEKGRFYTHLSFFKSIMSLSDAIQCAKSLYEFEKDIKTKLIKKSIYPICILLFAYLMLWFFSSSIIPQMMESFSMSDQFQGLVLFVSIMKGFCILFGIGSVGIFLFYIYLYCHRELRSKLLYTHHSRLTILKDFESYQFAGYLLEMHKKGISTKHALTFLISIDEKSVFHLLMQAILERLHAGDDYLEILTENTMLTEKFSMAFRVGATSSKLETMLSTFMKQQEFHWDKTIRKVSISLQIVSYTFVGFVVLIVYQIMLVPLSMLEQM